MMSLVELLSWLATFTTIAMFLTGLIDCKKIIDNDDIGAVPFLPFLLTHFSSGLWFFYGVLKEDATLKFVNAAGIGLSAIYMVCYISFSKSKSRQLTMLILCGFMAFCLEYYLNRVIRDRYTKTEYLSLACVVITVFMQASPLFSVVTVIKTRSTESMQFFFSVMMTLTSLSWFSYGYLLKDSTIMGPNLTGVVLGAFQLLLFAIFPSKKIQKTE